MLNKKKRRWKQNSVNVSTPIFFFRFFFFFPLESWAFNKLVDLGALSIQYLLLLLLLFVFVASVAVYVWATTLIAPYIFMLFFTLVVFRSIFFSRTVQMKNSTKRYKKHQHTLPKIATKWMLINAVSVSMLMTNDHKHRLRYGNSFVASAVVQTASNSIILKFQLN